MYVHNNQHIAYTARTYTLLEEGEGFTNCTHAEKEGERGRVEIIFLISHTVHITNTKLYVQCTGCTRNCVRFRMAEDIMNYISEIVESRAPKSTVIEDKPDS